MTTNDLRIGPAKQLGPLQVWPLIWEGLIAHNYKVPPNLDDLIFGEIEDEDGPSVDCIQVENPTDEAFIIPSGWIISANLWQDRTINSMEYIEPHSTVAVSVSCVEKSRWSPESKTIDGGRAPFSVIAAGFEYDASRGFWNLDSTSRQTRVWKQVSRQESRSGSRPTNSLRQVMEEDSFQSEIQSFVIQELNGNLISHPDVAKYAFLGPLVGAGARIAFAPLTDKFGGAPWTLVSSVGLFGSIIFTAQHVNPDIALGATYLSSEFHTFIYGMIAIFFFAGIGNASTFKQMPMIFEPRQAGGVIGWVSAIAAFGPFLFGIGLVAMSPSTFLMVLSGYVVLCFLITWFRYAKPGAAKKS